MMTEIVLDEQQTRLIATADGPIVIRDASGKTVAVVSVPEDEDLPTLTAAELMDLSHRINKPNPRWHTTEEVLRYLEEQDAS